MTNLITLFRAYWSILLLTFFLFFHTSNVYAVANTTKNYKKIVYENPQKFPKNASKQFRKQFRKEIRKAIINKIKGKRKSSKKTDATLEIFALVIVGLSILLYLGLQVAKVANGLNVPFMVALAIILLGSLLIYAVKKGLEG